MKNTHLVIKHLLYIPLLVASLFIGGCDLLSGERHSDFDESARDEESEEITICSPIPETEIESVILSEKEKRFVVKGNKFAFDMIDTLYKDNRSFAISPLSVVFDLAMVANGVNGAAREEIMEVIGENANSILDYNAYSRTLIEKMPAVDLGTTMKLSNAVLVDKRFEIRKSFRKSIESDYYGALKALSFSNPGHVADIINDWVKKNTEGLIPRLVDNIDSGTLACLVNALYYKGKWGVSFEKDATRKDVFHSDDQNIDMDFMATSGRFSYTENQRYSSVSLPLGKKGRYSFTIILPNENLGVQDVIDIIRNSGWEQISGGMKSDLVQVRIPKFRLDTHIDLIQYLNSVGINSIFSPCDFSEMLVGSHYLAISEAFQKAVLIVNEDGIEAAAATYMGAKGIMPPDYKKPEYKYFFADHPFVFVLRENSSGAILFTGVFSGK